MWFIGVEVEQETSAPPPKKNPGSAPEPECPRKYKFLIFTSMFRQVLNPANAINSFAKSLFPFFGLDCAQKHRPRLCLPFVNLLKIEKWCPSICYFFPSLAKETKKQKKKPDLRLPFT